MLQLVGDTGGSLALISSPVVPFCRRTPVPVHRFTPGDTNISVRSILHLLDDT